jgi:histidyl-tRNA synthetase
LNNGDYLKDVPTELLAEKASEKLVKHLSKRGLRYDLTVPFARFVVMNQRDLVFPFKRYQIQPVWRADRPQRGRYREFFQCDADVIGSESLLYEAELIQIYDEVFTKMNLPVVIKINNRKILQGIAEAANIAEKFMDMTVSIDKLDKIGMDGVRKELTERGIENDSILVIEKILAAKNFEEIAPFFQNSEVGQKGISELSSVFNFLKKAKIENEIQFDVTLARGLTYYTGCILEVSAKNIKMGSIGGGGRYDDLTGVFGLKDMSGVGVSFGADRIYDVLDELKLFPENLTSTLQLLFVSFDEKTFDFAFDCLQKVRKSGIAAEIYPDGAKIKKQMEYANRRGVPTVVVIGETEIETGKLTVKTMATGEQTTLSLTELIEKYN